MKKTILVAIFLGGIFAANAQTTPGTKVGTATLNVNLYPIQDITVNPAQKTVNLNYRTAANYKDGVSVNQEDHLTVYSTGAFAVSVNSLKSNLTNAIYAEKIKASDIAVTASKGTNALTGATFSEVTLSNKATQLIASDKGGVNKTFNVNYTASGALEDAYINKYYSAENPTVYSTEITYTIAAK